MKAKILLLLILSSIITGCRSKHKMTAAYKENRKETEKVKTDSFSAQNLKTSQSKVSDAVLKDEKNEMSGELLIKGTSDISHPFVFHNVVGSDTIQSISIIGTAAYSISGYYAKVDHEKSEVKKEKSLDIMQDMAQKVVSKEIVKEVVAAASEETKEIKANGLEAPVWIFITIIGMTLILLFFTYKYIKK